ncbi:MAG: alpha-amylase [Deltaproteobacteria bacterium]|nr:alpha-amylase [Deltaproteobacteria bacterium]
MPASARRASLALLAALLACSSGSKEAAPGPWRPGQPLTLDVSSTFPAGTVLRDAYGGTTATVAASGTVTFDPGAGGLLLLERDGAAATPFTWKNATVYFALTDRFANGDTANDASYGRARDGGDEVGTWHGGDWAGMTQKLDYLASLGVNALWISPIVEQVHGWVAGGSGGFKHHGYHGYWARDFTRLDANLGTEAELQALIDGAHQRGIRVIVDVVMNHPGYATGADLLDCLPQLFRDGTGAAFTAGYGGASPPTGKTWTNWNDLVDYGSQGWASWWGTGWIRAGLGGGYQLPGSTDQTQALNFLPDFKTESTTAPGAPPVFGLACMAGQTGVAEIAGATVRDYLAKWHTDWVRRLGVDGFRCDTAKHVELASWKALKDAGTAALADWKADPANAGSKLDDAPFWMTGEVFSHGVVKDAYYTDGGFDSLINFTFQPQLLSLLQSRGSLAAAAADLDGLYAGAAALVSTDPAFDVLTYLSSHDTQLLFDGLGASVPRYLQAGTALFLAPGGVQVFYGDESGRRVGPSGGDPFQTTRSDMNWTSTDPAILAHWQKLGAFRKRHAAVGAGAHARLTSPDGTYAFSRKLQGAVTDAVVAVIVPPAP